MRASFIVLCLPIIYMLTTSTIPMLAPYVQNVAVVSAGLTFIDSGAKLAAVSTSLEQDIATQFNAVDTEKVLFESPVKVVVEVPSPAPPVANKPNKAGSVTEKTFMAAASATSLQIGSGFLKNCTSISADKIKATTTKKPDFNIKANGSIEVLIMHTHATESYQSTLSPWFDKEYAARSTDNSINMISVGDRIEQQLKSAGIGVIHDTTLHDYPSYNGSYERSAITVKKILKENPTIKVVLDVHRDAIQPDADNIISPVTTINGKRAAQVMIISGCDNGKLNMPNYMENLKFSALLQNEMESRYKTLTRPILFDYRKYNQNLTTGSILIEVGGHGNTTEEAQYSGELIGKSLVTTLLKLKKGT